MFGHTACRLVVGPEVVQGRGTVVLGGFMGGGPVPPQVKPLMEMEPPPPLSARVPPPARLWPAQ